MAKILTGIHERAGFPHSEELFSAANGYLINQKQFTLGHFDVIITFLDPQNVDVDAISLTLWINFVVIVLVAAILDFWL